MENPSYAIELSYNNGAERFLLPVLPGKLEIRKKGRGATYTIIDLGQVNEILPRELAEIHFESFFPSQHYPFVGVKPDALLRPHEYIDYINRWMESKRPIRFIFVGSRTRAGTANQTDEIDLNLPMSIETFDRWEQAGSPGDVFYKIELKEYVFHAPRRARYTVSDDGQAKITTESKKRLDERARPDTYTIKPGDTLIKIALMWYGDSSRWRDIQKLNNITDAELKKLHIGRVIRLPKN